MLRPIRGLLLVSLMIHSNWLRSPPPPCLRKFGVVGLEQGNRRDASVRAALQRNPHSRVRILPLRMATPETAYPIP